MGLCMLMHAVKLHARASTGNTAGSNVRCRSVQVTIEQVKKRKQVALSMAVKGSKMTIIFGLLQDIDVITARCSDRDKSLHVLESLYPNDAGDSWPSGKQPSEEMHSMAKPCG
jgi:hypothetical protein